MKTFLFCVFAFVMLVLPIRCSVSYETYGYPEKVIGVDSNSRDVIIKLKGGNVVAVDYRRPLNVDFNKPIKKKTVMLHQLFYLYSVKDKEILVLDE